MTSQKFGPVEITAIIFLLLAPLYSIGATLPVHPPLSILIIADEVNPHNLSNADLTQPEDLAPALSASDSYFWYDQVGLSRGASLEYCLRSD